MIGLSLARYHVVFDKPARDASGRRLERDGALLELTCGGLRGAGELAPLPGRSRESLDGCAMALESLAPRALPSLSELGGADWLAAIQRASGLLPAELAAARHALETALLDLCGVLRGRSAAALLGAALGRPQPAALPVAALIDALDPAQACRQAEAAAAQGIRVAKLKIAGSEGNQAICARVQAVSATLRVRVDANRSLTAEQSAALAPALTALGVEFIEEPLPLSAVPQAAAQALPLGLDESLLDPDFSLAGAKERGASVLVLKPMLLGFLQALALAEQAAGAGFDVVLSHSFDGPLAMAASRSLALALGPRRYADGLAAHAALAAWPTTVPPHVSAPALSAWTSPGLGIP